MKKFLMPASLIFAAFFGFTINQKMRHDAAKNIDQAKRQIEHTKENIPSEAPQTVTVDNTEIEEEKRLNEARKLTQTALQTMTLEVARGEKCTENCNDMNAGFNWAKSQDFNEDSDCGGKTQAYKDGCQVYVDKYESLFDQNKELLETAAEAARNPAPPTNQVQ